MLEIPRNPLTERSSEGQSSCSYVYSKKTSINTGEKNETGHHIESFNKAPAFMRTSFLWGIEASLFAHFPHPTHLSAVTRGVRPSSNSKSIFAKNLNTLYYLIIVHVPNSKTGPASEK